MSNVIPDERLSAYLDGELSELEVARLERDLSSDPELRQALEALRGLRDHVRRHGPVRAPAGFADRVMDALAEEPAAPRWRRPFGVPLEALAVAAVGLLVLWLAVPTPEPKVELETTPTVRLEGLQDVYVAAPAYRLRLSGGRAEALQAAQQAGARVVGHGEVTLTMPASRVNRVREALQAHGSLEPIGDAVAVRGEVTFTLELLGP